LIFFPSWQMLKKTQNLKKVEKISGLGVRPAFPR
jgi:hypothetical protein